MKSLFILSLFVFAFVLVSGLTTKEIEEKLNAASTECNVTNPSQVDGISKISFVIAVGEKTSCASAPEWAHLHCVLQKVGILDEKSEVVSKQVIDFVVAYSADAKANKPLLHARIFNSQNKNKHLTDKHEKACALYHDIAEIIHEFSLIHLFAESDNEQQLFNEITADIDAPASQPAARAGM